MPTLKEKQAEFGPYYFGGESGESVTPSLSGTTSNLTSTPTTLGGMISQGLTGQAPSKGTTSLANLGLMGMSSLLGIPMGPVAIPTLALGLLSQLTNKMGLVGQDTSGMMGLSPSAIASLTNTTGLGPANAIAQGLGLTGGQLASLNAAAMGFDMSPATAAFADITNSPDASIGGTGQSTSASAPGSDPGSNDPGSGGVPDFHKGGPVGKTGTGNLLRGEYVVNPRATKLHRDLVERINSGATREELAGMMRGGKRS